MNIDKVKQLKSLDGALHCEICDASDKHVVLNKIDYLKHDDLPLCCVARRDCKRRHKKKYIKMIKNNGR